MLMGKKVELLKIHIHLMWLQIQAGRWCGTCVTLETQQQRQTGRPTSSYGFSLFWFRFILSVTNASYNVCAIIEWAQGDVQSTAACVFWFRTCKVCFESELHYMLHYTPHAAVHCTLQDRAHKLQLLLWNQHGTSAAPQHAPIPRHCVTRQLPASVTSVLSSDVMSEAYMKMNHPFVSRNTVFLSVSAVKKKPVYALHKTWNENMQKWITLTIRVNWTICVYCEYRT